VRHDSRRKYQCGPVIQRAADLGRGVHQARGQAGVLRRGTGHGQRHQRGEAQAGAGADQQRDREDVAQVRPARRGHGEQGQPGGDQPETREHQPAGAKAHHQPVGVAHRKRAHYDGDGQEGQADLQRVVAEDPAQVQRAEEEHPEHARGREHLDQVRTGHRA